jgi:putative transposase
VVDRIEALAAKYDEAWPAWGYRKIAGDDACRRP